jgi:hypothetical protein
MEKIPQRVARALCGDIMTVLSRPYRHIGVGYAPADTTDQMVMRIFDGLEVGNGHPEIKLAQVALRDQHTQIAGNGAQDQTRETALNEPVNLIRRQMAAVTLNGFEYRLALF